MAPSATLVAKLYYPRDAQNKIFMPPVAISDTLQGLPHVKYISVVYLGDMSDLYCIYAISSKQQAYSVIDILHLSEMLNIL